MPLTPTPAGPPYVLDRPTLARQVRIDTFRASGPGGQHLQRTESAVRLTHLPSGVVVIASDTRSQIRNRAVSFERRAERLARLTRRPNPRKPTRPGKAAKERRLEAKKHRGARKRLRADRHEE